MNIDQYKEKECESIIKAYAQFIVEDNILDVVPDSFIEEEFRKWSIDK